MIGRKTILPNGKAMLLGGIALIAIPAIVGILLVQTHHILVAMSLSQHRGSGNVGIFAVTLDNTLIGQTTASITGSRTDKFVITVRENANGNGWL